MGQTLAVIDEVVDALQERNGQSGGGLGATEARQSTHLDGEMHAVTQVHSLERTQDVASPPHETLDGEIGDVVAFYKTNPPKFGEQCELTHAGIGQSQTTGQVDVSDPGARLR